MDSEFFASGDAVDALGALAAAKVSSEELLEAQLDRIERFDGDLNAVVAMDIDRARARCREADAATARGESWGPLHGLPMTVKDSYETEGLVTTSGAPELAAHIPQQDADGVRLLKDAGAIVFAKTNLPLYAGDIQTFNEVYGLTRNPWNLERTVGGSSGGAAAALAAGFTLLELGSDIGGSIRCPAHYCGVFGLKPSWWVVSRRGHIPGPPGVVAPSDLTVTGPMGRSIRDLVVGLDALEAGGVMGVPTARLPKASGAVRELRGCRVGLWASDPVGPISADTSAALLGLAEKLAGEGAEVVDNVRPPMPTEEWFALYLELLLSVMSPRYDEPTRELLASVAASAGIDSTEPAVAAARGAIISHARWLHLDEARHQLARDWDQIFAEVDVVLAPVAPGAAFAHDETPIFMRFMDVDGQQVHSLLHMVWAGLATLPYLPSAVVPIGQSREGLPIGVQVISPRWHDRTALEFGRRIEELLGGFTPPPGYS